MQDKIKTAPAYDLKQFILSDPKGKHVDIRFLTNRVEFNESMSTGYISGYAHIFDGQGLLDNFPIRGQESLDLIITDFDGNEFNHRFYLYGVSDVKKAKKEGDGLTSYTIHFVSKHRYVNESVHVRQAFRDGTMSDYIGQLFSEYFETPEKTLVVDPSDNPFNIVVPGYSPIDTAHLFARKAYSSKWRTGTYRFFETKRDFQFRNNESIIEEYKNKKRQAKKFTHTQMVDSSPDGQMVLRRSIVDFRVPTHVDSIRDLQRGLYNRNIIEVDYHNRQVVEYNSKHLDNVKDYLYPEKIRDVHDDWFNKVAIEPLNIVISKNYLSTHDPSSSFYTAPTMTPEVVARKMVAWELYGESMISVTVHGDLSLNCGDMVELEMPVFDMQTDNRRMENSHNGMYLVESIQHSFADDSYYAHMQLGRLGLKDYSSD